MTPLQGKIVFQVTQFFYFFFIIKILLYNCTWQDYYSDYQSRIPLFNQLKIVICQPSTLFYFLHSNYDRLEIRTQF